MPLDRLVLITVCVLISAAVTVWLSVILLASFSVPFGWLALIPASLVGYVVFRVISERVGNKTENHYDEMEN
jgi:ABC-type transport system involved in cytochrome bd biosynthesis fused ATPase/permease subunit